MTKKHPKKISSLAYLALNLATLAAIITMLWINYKLIQNAPKRSETITKLPAHEFVQRLAANTQPNSAAS